MSEMDFGAAADTAEKRRVRAVRREHDAYMTDPRLAQAIVERVKEILPSPPRRIVEPSCGEGDFIRPCQIAWSGVEVVGIDIRAEVGPKINAIGAKFLHANFLSVPPQALAIADLIITNPPFDQFARFVRHALSGMRDHASLVLLGRVGMLAWGPTQEFLRADRDEADARKVLWQETANERDYLAAISPRPSFTSDGKTDSQEYGIMVWRKGANVTVTSGPRWGETILWTPEKVKARRAPRKPAAAPQPAGALEFPP